MRRERRRVRQDLALDRCRCRAPLLPVPPRSASAASFRSIACCAGLAVAGALVRWRDAVRRPRRRHVRCPRDVRCGRPRVLLPASIAIAVLHALFVRATAPSRSAIVVAVLPVLLGWSIFLLLPLARPTDRSRRHVPPRCRTPHDRRRSRGGDDRGARRPHASRRSLDVDRRGDLRPAGAPLRSGRLSLASRRRRFSGSSRCRSWCRPRGARTRSIRRAIRPSSPAFVALGAPSASGAMLGAVAVASTYMLGRRCASPFVGVVAAALLATHFLFLGYASRYLSHVAAMAAITSAAWLLLTPPSASQQAARRSSGMLAGLLIGIAVTIRPVTAHRPRALALALAAVAPRLALRCATPRCCWRSAW